MKSINTYFTTNDNLKNLINYNNFSNSKSLLIQIFISFNDPIKIKKLLFFIREILPNAVVIGSTTDGEIMNGKVSTNEIVINFTEFESTTLEFASIVHEDDGYFSGKYLAHRLISEDTKLLIAFGDGLYTNGESFLNGINEVNSDIIIAGGLAGDRATFTSTYVFTQDAIIVKGAVAVALNSKKLHVNTDYSFNWQTIGKELIITEAKANRVYSIDNQKAIDVYSHYLGDHIVENLPELGIEFPLIVNRNGMNIARAMLAKEEDGSLIFAGNLNVGDKVRFGYGNSKDILRQSNKMFERVQQHPSEAIFTYSCMARRHFMSHDIESEILPLQDIAPVSGFFTYGEFFNCVKNELLNQTMTLLSLSEDEVIDTNVKYQKRDETSDSSSLGILVHLVNATSREVEDQNRKLQKQKISFETLFEKSSDGVLIIEDGKFIQCNWKIVEILHYDSKADILNLHPSQLSPEFQPDGSNSYDKAQEMMSQAFESGGHIFEWMHTRSDGENFWAEIVLTPISLEDRDVIHVVWRDISKRKDMESKLQNYTDELELRVEDEVKKNKFQQQKLFDQSRMAQMGEMISMIAHQWRQPLGAISATAIDLKMQMMLNSFDLDEDEDREKCKIYFDSRLDDIGTFVQNLTNTIDDFRNFYKPNKESKELLMREPIMKALNIVRASFEAEGIEMIESYSSATKIKIHENEMMQVILNILKNAQDNFKEKDIREAQINIITKDIDHKTIIEISDNGGGINEDILPNIFDPYFSTKSEKNGTGLGLYMSKMIVEEHHEGNLSVENRDNGVCFIIKI